MYLAELLRPTGVGKYTWLKAVFFNEGDKILAPGKPKGQAYELHLANIHEYKRNVGIMRLNSETGQPIALNNGTTVSYPPPILHRLLGVEHVAGAVRSAKRGDTNLIMILLAGGMCLAIGLMLGMNMEGIVQAFTGKPPSNATFVRPLVEMVGWLVK